MDTESFDAGPTTETECTEDNNIPLSLGMIFFSFHLRLRNEAIYTVKVQSKVVRKTLRN